eukprot:TRINITY_DN1585_c0_g4_i1.p1 TRINITY_DN1585_c0_g4~~TRINITY_DN1585_c0_g4_i1.p1  ORF type:complete len:1005 (+),score=307.86 TRINITY_DN1585_c0_g4_i1:134-3148(+)
MCSVGCSGDGGGAVPGGGRLALRTGRETERNPPQQPLSPPGSDEVPSDFCSSPGGDSRSEALMDSPLVLPPAAPAGTAPARPRRKRRIVINTYHCRYDIVRTCAQEMDWVEDNDEEGERNRFTVLWCDGSVSTSRLAQFRNWQRANHFPAMHLIARKNSMALVLDKMRSRFPEDYAFYPRTWSVRSGRAQMRKDLSEQRGRRTYIIKPSAGCQGKGILLTQDPVEASEDYEDAVVQEYIARPLLIESKKFDLRIYVLVTSVRFPSVFVLGDGLVRMCTSDYVRPTADNLDKETMHLTNYAINKQSENFVANESASDGSVGSKRDFNFLNMWLQRNGFDPDAVWRRIDGVIVKTLISALPHLNHMYCTCFRRANDGWGCFEILGFDLLLDECADPWLLEVNHMPSLHCDSPLDLRIKKALVLETMRILSISADDRAGERGRQQSNFRKRNENLIRRQEERKRREEQLAKQGSGPPQSDAQTSRQLEEEFRKEQQEEEARRLEAVAVAQRAKEDAALQHFRRVLPCSDPELQRLYDSLMQGAKEASAPATTAATQMRDAESRRERTKREGQREQHRAAAARARGGAQSPAPGSPRCLSAGRRDPGTVPNYLRARSPQRTEDTPREASPMSADSSSSSTAECSPRGQRGDAPDWQSTPRTPAADPPQAVPSGPLPRDRSSPIVVPVQRSNSGIGPTQPPQQLRLSAQMDQHKRRLILARESGIGFGPLRATCAQGLLDTPQLTPRGSVSSDDPLRTPDGTAQQQQQQQWQRGGLPPRRREVPPLSHEGRESGWASDAIGSPSNAARAIRRADTHRGLSGGALDTPTGDARSAPARAEQLGNLERRAHRPTSAHAVDGPPQQSGRSRQTQRGRRHRDNGAKQGVFSAPPHAPRGELQPGSTCPGAARPPPPQLRPPLVTQPLELQGGRFARWAAPSGSPQSAPPGPPSVWVGAPQLRLRVAPTAGLPCDPPEPPAAGGALGAIVHCPPTAHFPGWGRGPWGAQHKGNH